MSAARGRFQGLRNSYSVFSVTLLLALVLTAGVSPVSAATIGNVAGEIQTISVDDPADHWSGGTIVVGGRTVIIPRNLLIDLPANRVTLQQLYADAPGACVALGETGLAKGDTCNTSGMGAFATISANKTNSGNIIAGDVLIDKGLESVTGVVTYIDYDNGYFRLDGNPGDNTTGVMIRLNDPDGRHTVQRGPGCTAETLANNCSADPRFTLDSDNYTNVFSTGYPFCIPSTVARTFTDVLGLGTTTAQANPDGSGDVLCPTTNRTVNLGFPVDDSRRFAPVMMGDSVTAEGNFETINGVHFLSSHTTLVNKGLTTKNDPAQPDYLFIAEAFMDAPGFNNARARTLFIGFTTLPSTNVTIWSIHRDPQTNSQNEFPLADVLGCELASGGGGGNCTNQGIGGGLGNHIFKIRHDVDFLAQPTDPKLDPCAHLRAGGFDVCPQGGTFAEQFAILSPIPHEIVARTAHQREPGSRVTLDVNGNEATNGVYLFPFGANLGGIGFPEFVEINLDQVATPNIFAGIPWNLDRRLSPNGCPVVVDAGGAETAACEPLDSAPLGSLGLDPFPFSGLDPRTQAGTPTGNYSDPAYTASTLTFARDRILSYVDGNIGNFDGNNTLAPYPPADPAAIPIEAITPVTLSFIPLPPPPATGVTLVALPEGPLPAGSSATFVAVGAGGSGTYEYQFYLYDGVTYTLEQPYSTASTWTWDTAGVTPGSYAVVAYARSLGSTASSEAGTTLSYQVLEASAPATDMVLSASPAGSAPAGSKVFFNASVAGGGTYEYQFYLFDGAAYTLVQPYSTASTWTWNTTGVTPGSYGVVAYARTLGSAASSEAGTSIGYQVLPASAPATGVTLSATPGSPAAAGTTVFFHAVADGGGTYEYQFYLFDGAAYTLVQPYSTASTWTWDTTGVTPGSYGVVAYARGVGSAASSEAGTSIPYDVN